jgi:uncharacterized membrane protein YfhO
VTEEISTFFNQDRHFLGVAAGNTTLRPVISVFPNTTALENRIRSDAQKLQGLLARQFNIKSAIFRSNHTTYVEVGGKRMTVVEAVYMKSTLAQREQVLNGIRNSIRSAVVSFDTKQKELDTQLNSLREKQANSQDSEANKNLIQALENNLKETVQPVYVDPINYRKLVEDEQTLINQLKTELDYILSTSNTVTMVDIPD